MLFNYNIIDTEGKEQKGQIEAGNSEFAIVTLQKRGFVVVSLAPVKESFLNTELPFFNKVPNKDIVLMTRQAATLFEAQVSAVRVFTLLSENTENVILKKSLVSVTTDIKGGISMSNAMAKQPKIFSSFFVSMVNAGEESGKLTEIFNFLAAHMERSYALSSKTKNALVYPSFIISTFLIVMILMLVKVIPQLAGILLESGQEIPFYTKVVIGISNLFVNYGFFVLIFLVVLGFYIWRGLKTKVGKASLDKIKIKLPIFGKLFSKLYLARIADNIDTMTSAGIPIIRTLEITAETVDNSVYNDILTETLEDVKGGQTVSEAFKKHEEIPSIMVQMVKVGEETGSLGEILKTLARFYTQEVNNAVDTLIGLIEPAMIALLGVGVGSLLASVLVPIYNIAGSI